MSSTWVPRELRWNQVNPKFFDYENFENEIVTLLSYGKESLGGTHNLLSKAVSINFNLG